MIMFYDYVSFMFLYKIYFRLKHGFKYEDTCMLDHAFVNWAYPRVKYFLLKQIKLKEVEEKVFKDYSEMLDLIQDLKDNYVSCDEKSLKKYKRFCSLFRKYSDGSWLDY